MEWLEFSPWSPEVEWGLALQAARLAASHPSAPPTPHVDARTLASCLHALVRQYPPSNPWGHPPADA